MSEEPIIPALIKQLLQDYKEAEQHAEGVNTESSLKIWEPDPENPLTSDDLIRCGHAVMSMEACAAKFFHECLRAQSLHPQGTSWDCDILNALRQMVSNRCQVRSYKITQNIHRIRNTLEGAVPREP